MLWNNNGGHRAYSVSVSSPSVVLFRPHAAILFLVRMHKPPFWLLHISCKPKDVFVKRIRSLYFPFLYYSIPIILLHNAFAHIGFYENAYDIKGIIMQLCRTCLMSIGETEPLLPQLWFLKVLFLMEIMYACVVYMASKLRIEKEWLIIPLNAVALLVNCDNFPRVMRMNFLFPLRAMLYYYLGVINVYINKRGISRRIMSFALLGVVAWRLHLAVLTILISSVYMGLHPFCKLCSCCRL